MAHSVKLRTAVPSVAEFGKTLGISEKRQKALISLVTRGSGAMRVTAARERNGASSNANEAEKVPRATKR